MRAPSRCATYAYSLLPVLRMVMLIWCLLRASYISCYTSQRRSCIARYVRLMISSSEQTFMDMDGSHYTQMARGPGESRWGPVIPAQAGIQSVLCDGRLSVRGSRPTALTASYQLTPKGTPATCPRPAGWRA